MASWKQKPGKQSSENKAGWRGKAAPPPPTARRRWRETGRTPGEQDLQSRRLRHKTMILATSVAALGLLGAFVWYLIGQAKQLPMIVFAVTNYPSPLPPNSWAWEDAEQFKVHPDQGDITWTAAVEEGDWRNEEEALDALARQVHDARPGGPDKNVVVLYLSAHGATDDAGEPVLLLGESQNAAGDDEGDQAYLGNDRWLRVSKLVKRLDESRPGIKKVLLLDASRMHSNWNIGLLYNGFTRQLPNALKGARDVVILNSASPGEVGWTAPEARATPFGYYVWLGLQGFESDTNHDKAVSLGELADFVRTNVRRWVRRKRYDVQTPMLIAPDGQQVKGISLVFAGRSRAGNVTAPSGDTAEGEPADSLLDVDSSEKYWKLHDRFLDIEKWGPYDPLPRDRLAAWEEFRHLLVRYEQLQLGGRAYRDQVRIAGERLNKLRAVVDRPQTEPQIAAHSLPLAEEHSGAKRKRKPREMEDLAKSLLDVSRDLVPDRFDYLERARAGWDLLRQNPTPNLFDRALGFVGLPQTGPELIEVRFLRMLHPRGDLPDTVKQSPTTYWAAALDCRDLAEQAAAPADERVHYWLRNQVAAADELRREAEDNLFVGRAESLAEAADQWSRADASYRTAQKQGQLLTRAYALRDRAYSQLPHLAQWFTRRLSPQDADARTVEKLDRQTGNLIRTIGRTHELGRLLDAQISQILAGETPEADKWADFENDVNRLAVNLQDLGRFVDTAIKDVLDSTSDNRLQLRRIEALLATPLTPSRERMRLWSRYRDTALADATSLSDPGKAVADDNSKSLDEQTYLRRAAEWERHPAIALLDPAALEARGTDDQSDSRSDSRAVTGKGDDPKRLAESYKGLIRNAKQARVWLAAVNDTAATWMKIDPSAEPAEVRAAVSRADRLMRAASPLAARLELAGARGTSEGHPAVRLTRFDVYHVQLWQAQRALDDFWGPGTAGETEERDTAAAPTQYFAAIAKSYRQGAKQLGNFNPKLFTEQNEILTRREKAAADRRVVVASTTQNRPFDDPSGMRMAVTLNQAQDLPPGRAAIFLRDPIGVDISVRDASAGSENIGPRLAMNIADPPPSPAEIPLLFQRAAEKTIQSDEIWNLIGLYRGHRHQETIYPLSPDPPITLRHEPRRPERTSITVLGKAKDPGVVVFVLDCSGSMAPSEKNKFVNRMDIARKALQRILKSLSDAGGYQVGLWFYGRRVGVSRTTGQVVLQPVLTADEKAALANKLPGDDVERAISPRPLNEGSLDEFLAIVKKAEPYGQTPLYRSICDAITDPAAGLANEPTGAPRRLIVITDGNNEVTLAKEEKEVGDVIKAFEGANRGANATAIRFDLVGIDVGDRTTLDDLLKDKQVRGRFYDVGNLQNIGVLNELDRALAKALGIFRYQVAELKPDGAEEIIGTQQIDDTVEVDKRDSVRREYMVRLLDAGESSSRRVHLWGGEALQLTVRQADSLWQLWHVPPVWEESAFASAVKNRRGDLNDDLNPPEFRVAVRPPEPLAASANNNQTDITLNFPITIENEQRELFSPRPAEAWVEITPVPNNEPLFRYPIFDLAWDEDSRPVPMLRCVTPQWPATARRAEVRIWFKLEGNPTLRMLEVTVADTLSDAAGVSQLALPGAPDVQFSVKTLPPQGNEGARVVITEQHPSGLKDPQWVKVTMRQPPDKTLREYFPRASRAQHTFTYQGRDQAAVDGFQLRLTSRADIEQGAVAPESPLIVTIPQTGP